MGTRDNAGDQVLGSGDDPGDRKAEDWRRRWWLSDWGSANDIGDFVAWKLRRHWRLISGWGLKKKLAT